MRRRASETEGSGNREGVKTMTRQLINERPVTTTQVNISASHRGRAARRSREVIAAARRQRAVIALAGEHVTTEGAMVLVSRAYRSQAQES